MELRSSLHAKPQVENTLSTRTKASATIEARLSTAQHRVRNAHIASMAKASSAGDLESNASMNIGNMWRIWLPSMSTPTDAYSQSLSQRLPQSSRVRWSLVVYCAFCLFFLTLSVYTTLSLEYLSVSDVVEPRRFQSFA